MDKAEVIDQAEEALETTAPIDILTYENKGLPYTDVLKKFHEQLRPKTYFEIGTLQGATLALSRAKTIAVDPCFKLIVSPVGNREVTMFFQMPSDEFFARHDPLALFGEKIDLAFLDGLHYFEFLLRDFINTEKSCKANSIIALHDCIPMNLPMTTRANPGGFWTGDVWKLVLVLKEYRPQVKLYSFDAWPTGLICCTGLDPQSNILSENYHAIVDQWRDVNLDEYGLGRFIDEIDVKSTDLISNYEGLTQYFWL